MMAEAGGWSGDDLEALVRLTVRLLAHLVAAAGWQEEMRGR
ncbi:hypothetical protein HRbin24_00015 [bacterium HR24]|jgi:hypothetical protein|nr:hypothetical protein [Chloroflexota bacterium]GBD12015.1 hypothetical protein HRbin24_00015 [bacterium HR24]